MFPILTMPFKYSAFKARSILFYTLFILLLSSVKVSVLAADKEVIEELVVWQDSSLFQSSNTALVGSTLNSSSFSSINIATTEDLAKFEPSVIIRRRYIGDFAGTLGIRGASMFQTARSMVFADGVPLHYLLQTQWRGAPRWSLVSASEIDHVEIIYGPFSAQYSGNAMGGVVLIETSIPEEQEFHLDIKAFSQEANFYDFDDRLEGGNFFASYGNRLGNFSYYLSFNRLSNHSAPQFYRGSDIEAQTAGEFGAIDVDNENNNVSGGILRENYIGEQQLWFGDTGIVKSDVNNFKIKLGYDASSWQALFNFALEDRSESTDGNSYIFSNNGIQLWSGVDLAQLSRITQDDSQDEVNVFSFSSATLNNTFLERESISFGLRVRKQLADTSELELNASHFDLIKDRDKETNVNILDERFDNSGEIAQYRDTGWNTFELKYRYRDILSENSSLVSGIRFEEYELNLDVFETLDYFSGINGDLVSRFGGITRSLALYTELDWHLDTNYQLSLGARYEDFESPSGYYTDISDITNDVEIINAPGVDYRKTSPKFSFTYNGDTDWFLRYSLAKAYRFPIVEELYRQYSAFNSRNLAIPELKPENGLHQNVTFEKPLENGYFRFNFFQDDIKDAIESQTIRLSGGAVINTFAALDKTRVRGAEFVLDYHDMYFEGLNIRLNVSYTDAKVLEVDANPEWEGNVFPRIPKWRSKVLLNYQNNSKWLFVANLQYASDSFNDLDNGDDVDQVFGAQDAFSFLGLKLEYQWSDSTKTSIGVDNITNEEAYVTGPWPGRTVYVNYSYSI